MAGERRDSIDYLRRRRYLASDARTAWFARSEARKRQLSFARDHWGVLGVAVVGVPVSALPVALVADGAQRGVVIGAAVASGLWVAILMVVVLSGASVRFAGALAEEWTTSELRRLRRSGWRLVNG